MLNAFQNGNFNLAFTCPNIINPYVLAGSIGGQCRLSPRRSVPVGIGPCPRSSVTIGPGSRASIVLGPGSRAAVAVLRAVPVPPEVIPVISDGVVAAQRVTHFVHHSPARANSLALKKLLANQK